jgi:hypothetical protein
VGIEVCLSQTAVCKEDFLETGMVAGGSEPDLVVMSCSGSLYQVVRA